MICHFSSLCGKWALAKMRCMEGQGDFVVEGFIERLMPGQVAPALFQALPEVSFWMKDGSRRFVYVNKAFCHDLAGRNEDDLLGKRDEDIFPPELARVFRRDDEQVLGGGKTIWNKSELVPNRSGVIEWRSTSKIPLLDNRGEVVGTAGIGRRMGAGQQEAYLARTGGVAGSGASGGQGKLSTIVAAIYEHIGESVSVPDLAKAASVSVSTLERLFKEHMGTTPRRFILHAKMSTACEYLLRTNMLVKEVAEKLGYDDHANFTRAFSKLMNMSPLSYRRLYRRS